MIRTRLVWIGLAAAFNFFPNQTKAEIKWAFVDTGKILKAYAPVADIQKQLEQENDKWGQELKDMEERLQTLKQEMEELSLILSEDRAQESKRKIRELSEQIDRFRNEKWGEDGELFRRQKELFQPIRELIQSIIHRIAQEEDFDLVLDAAAGQLLFAKEKFDITERVISELEKETPGVSDERRK